VADLVHAAGFVLSYFILGIVSTGSDDDHVGERNSNKY